MVSRIAKATLLVLIVFAFFIPASQITAGQELSAGAKLVGTTPFVFAEARLWIFSLELGAGLAASDSANSEYGYETGPIDFSLSGKIYPIEMMNLSPYLGMASRASLPTNNQPGTVTGLMVKLYRVFAGLEFNFPGQNIPLSVFGAETMLQVLLKASRASAGIWG